MLISCEKCSTTYVLDDTLIPPQGAPVQCTRCGHVFTARLTQPDAPPPPRAPTPAAGNSTMMFGAPAAPPPAAAKNQTMMFGTPASSAAPPAASPKPPPAANPKATMVFGTAASTSAAAPQAPAAPANARSTMMFGAPPAAPAPAKNQTMMFGTAASNAPPSQPAAPAAPPVGKQTMVFGSAQPPPPAAPANPKATMVFGTAASNAAPPKENVAAASKTTMMFGSPVAAPPAAPAAPKNQTMMFGTPASIAADSTSESEETVMDLPGQSSRTVLFGTAQPPGEEAPPAEQPVGNQNKTMMFGKPVAIPKVTPGTVELAGYAADEDENKQSTVRVDLQEVIEGQEGEAPAAGEGEGEGPSRQDRTQRFAMSDLSTPPAGRPSSTSIQDRHNRTQLFAMTQDNTVPTAEPLREEPLQLVGDTTLPPGGSVPALGAVRASSTDLNSTLPLDPPGVSLLHDPSTAEASQHDSGPDQPLVMTLPNLQPIQSSRPMPQMPIELPPEPGGSPEDFRASPPVLTSQQQAAEDAAAIRAARGGGGAGKAIVIILVIVALGLAGVLVYRLFGKQLFGQAVPVEAIRTADQALARLRVDDGQSQEKALAELKAAIERHPNVPETQAAYVIATALRYDDVQGRALREQEKLRSLKSQEAPEKEIAALEQRLATDVADAKSMRAELEAAQGRLQTLKVGLQQGTPADLAVLRAEGLARGVLGDTEAIPTAEAFRQRSSAPDDWADLIEPEFALNGGSSYDEAIVQLDRVKRRESTFLRPYVLLARLQLKKGDVVRARAELEQVSTMNSRHEIAQELLSGLP